MVPMCQKMEKSLMAGDFAVKCQSGELVTRRNDVKAEQQADDLIEVVMVILKTTLEPYEALLLPSTVTQLLNEVAGVFGSRLESAMVKVKYTQQGVLQLDKVIRALCNELINQGGSEIRTNFSKANHLIAILSCDDVEVKGLCDR